MVVGAIGDVVAGQLITAMDGLKNVLRDSIAFSDNAQKASLALGQTYSQTKDKLAPAMDGLRGDLNEKFAAGIAGMEAGMQGNTKGLAKLINQQRLTGTQSANTSRAIAGLEAGLDLSRDQTNNLAESLVQTGNEYGVSTDKLVAAVDALKATFPAQALAGMGDKVMGAVTNLQAELGPQLAGPLNNVMKMVLDTTFEGQERLTKLNIGGVREQLANARDATHAQEILSEAFKTASQSFKSIAAGAGDNFLSIAAANEVFGEQSMAFTTIAAGFGDRVKQEGTQALDFGATLETVRKEVFLPLQETFASMYPLILQVATLFGGALSSGIQMLVEVGQRFWVQLGGLEGISIKLKASFADFKVKVIDSASLIKNVLGVAFVALATKIIFMTAVALAPLVIGLASLTVGVLAAAVPFLPLIAAVALVAFVIKKLNDKFNFMDPIIEGVTNAFKAVKIGIGDFLIGLGEIHGIPDALIDWGNALKGTKQDITSMRADPLVGEKLTEAFEEQIKQDALFASEALGVAEKTEKHTKTLADQVKSEKEASSTFLDETTATLGRTIQDIIGVDADDTQQEILQAILDQTDVVGAGGGGGGGSSLNPHDN